MDELNKNLDEILDFEEVGICMTDADKKVLHQNERCKQVCGEQLNKACFFM